MEGCKIETGILTKIFQIAVVFIGTIVGAGLGLWYKKSTQFFTSYGLSSFIGIICLWYFLYHNGLY